MELDHRRLILRRAAASSATLPPDRVERGGRSMNVFPASAEVVDGELTVGGVRAAALADEFGTPLVVYSSRRCTDRPARTSTLLLLRSSRTAARASESRAAPTLRRGRPGHRRLHPRGSPLRPSGRRPGRADRRPRNSKATRSCGPPPRPASRSSSSIRSTRSSGRLRRASLGCSCAPRSGIDAETHEAVRPRTTARSSGCRPSRRWRLLRARRMQGSTSWGCTPTSARSYSRPARRG